VCVPIDLILAGISYFFEVVVCIKAIRYATCASIASDVCVGGGGRGGRVRGHVRSGMHTPRAGVVGARGVGGGVGRGEIGGDTDLPDKPGNEMEP
jgi:hypothetical protein